MELTPSLLVIAVGAVLRFAVTATVSGVNLHTVGVILMVVGIVGFLLSLVWLMSNRRTVVAERPVEVAPTEYREVRYR